MKICLVIFLFVFISTESFRFETLVDCFGRRKSLFWIELKGLFMSDVGEFSYHLKNL